MLGGGPALQLGDASSIPVPGDEDTSPSRKREQTAKGPGPNKAAKGDLKREVMLTYADMQSLLVEQAQTILQANRAHAQGLLDALETRHGTRLEKLENGTDKLAEGLQGVEERLSALERELRSGPARDETAERRRTTLVFGGWDRDTKRDKVLSELEQALSGLNLKDQVSDRPFTTGPRRSVALLNFPLMRQETDEQRRQRMHEVVLTVSQSQVLTSAGKKMWCAYSKTKQQRDISGHCSWIKRALSQLSEDLVRSLDVEYSSGSVWLGDSLVASAVKQPNNGAKSEKMMTGRGSPPGWVDLELLGKESKFGEAELREALEHTRR